MRLKRTAHAHTLPGTVLLTRSRRPLTPFALAAAVALLSACAEDRPRPLALATGTTAGVYYPLGGAMASRWTRDLSGIVVKAEVSAGSVTNLIQVAKGESDIGFGQADAVADAFRGTGRFPEPLPLAVLGRIYPNIVHLLSVEGRDVRAVPDLRGKRVSLGPPGSGNEVTARNVLRAVGIAEDEFRVRQMNYNQSINGLKDGTVDAVFLAAGLGVSSVIELGLTRDLVLVPFTPAEIAAVEAANSAYRGIEVPPGVYRGVDVPTLAPSLWNILFVHRDLPADLAKRLTESVLAGRDEFRSVTRNADFIEIESLGDIGSLPLHPGARAFYEEARARDGGAPGSLP
ncbi:MAG: TAXI family TRAP transporter solute-binding subunit [Acidobacteria bacterium]|nr:TAXI family TRAP transporter solute-binding subunit [Acidobacteriota bacterium]MYA47115.1 TAXI family TRAP transporter solute-binding subunit [Acidobacteriota bacterium]MYI40284.1 TAXI family TRAP transporter solute-binding subunit [Acidobacteriota bacterium]